MNNTSPIKYSYFFIAIAAIFLMHTLFLACVAEDSYITFRFAKNLAEGHGFVWNIGEPPVEGFTNFLWVVICASIAKLGLPIPTVSQILGVIFSLGTMWCSYLFSLNILRLKGWHALLPVMFLAFSGPFATWATSGMETNMFGFFLIAGCYFYSKYWTTDNFRNLWYSFFILFLATLTRPEGFLIFGLLVGLSILVMPGRSTRTIRDVLPAMAFYLVPFLVYFLWRYNYFGYLLPNTFYAKTGGGILQYKRGIIHVLYFYVYFILPLAIPLLILSIFDKSKLRDVLSDIHLFNSNTTRIARHMRSNIGAYACILIIAAYTAYITYVGGDYMAMFRFFVPILSFLYLLCGYILVYILKMCESRNKNKLFIGGTILSILIIIIQSTPLERKIFPRMPNNHGTYRGVKFEHWHAARLSIIGQYFNRTKKSYAESLATGGIGATSYNADMRIIGLHGLVDTYLAHKTFAPGTLGKGLPGHERGDLPYIFSKKPSYFMFSRYFTKQPAEIPAKLLNEVGDIIKKEYVIESVWLEDPINKDSGYFTYLKRSSES